MFKSQASSPRELVLDATSFFWPQPFHKITISAILARGSVTGKP